MSAEAYEDFIPVPRAARLKLPLAIDRPEGFVVSAPESWPHVQGRLEFYDRRLWFIPPCGDEQQDVAVSVVSALHGWARKSGAYVVGGNEAGILIDGEARGADAAVRLRTSLPPRTGRFRTCPGRRSCGLDEDEADLRRKAQWYFANGVKLLPRTREVVVLTKGGRTRRVKNGDAIPPTPLLPGLSMRARDCFDQL
ncbi:MAG: hypothetical protein JNM69_20355 [Archangium sp.]|nr:hypothetical protein [Archangium sp.]